MSMCRKHDIISNLLNENDNTIIINYLITKCECDICCDEKLDLVVHKNTKKNKISFMNDNNAYFIYQSWMKIIKTRIFKEKEKYNYYINNKLYRHD